MTGSELRKARDVIGWSRSQIARRLRCDEGTIRAMESDARPVPASIAGWVRTIAAVIDAAPTPGPDEWMQRPPKRE